jgi:hypothetical protein
MVPAGANGVILLPRKWEKNSKAKIVTIRILVFRKLQELYHAKCY